MPSVNPLNRWRQVISPAPSQTVASVASIAANGMYEVRLQSGTIIRASAQGGQYNLNDSVLVRNGEIVRQVANLPYTEQGV